MARRSNQNQPDIRRLSDVAFIHAAMPRGPARRRVRGMARTGGLDGARVTRLCGMCLGRAEPWTRKHLRAADAPWRPPSGSAAGRTPEQFGSSAFDASRRRTFVREFASAFA